MEQKTQETAEAKERTCTSKLIMISSLNPIGRKGSI